MYKENKITWKKCIIILTATIAVVIFALVLVTRISAKPSSVPLFSTAITDEAARDRIMVRLGEENVESQVNAAGVISVKDEATARRMRSILIREDLVPSSVDPWALFDIDRWSTTDFERNVNLRRSITEVVKQHIEALDDVDRANVVVIMPENALFAEDQNPVTACVVLYTKPGSDLTTNRKKVEGVQKIILKAVEGLKADNIVISDSSGNILNDFEGMTEIDNVSVAEKEQKLIQKQEAVYRAKVWNALQQTFGNDRVRDLNVKVEMDFPNEPEKSFTIDSIKVSVNIDGTWKKKYAENGKLVVLPNGSIEREYLPVPDDDIATATLLVQNVIGYDRSRGDSVSVVCTQFDRTKEFNEEDAAYLRQQQTHQTLLIIGISLAVLLVAFILFRIISREIEERKRLDTYNTEQIAIDMTGPAYNSLGEYNEHIEILNKGEAEKNGIILKKLSAKWNDIFERKDFFERISPKSVEHFKTIGNLPDGGFIQIAGTSPHLWNHIALVIKSDLLESVQTSLKYRTKDNKVLSIDIKKKAFGAVIVLSFISEENTIKIHIYITPHGAPILPDLREPDIIDAQINVKLPKNKAVAVRITMDDIFAKLGIEKFLEKAENFVQEFYKAYNEVSSKNQEEQHKKQIEDSKEKVKADIEKLNKALSELDSI